MDEGTQNAQKANTDERIETIEKKMEDIVLKLSRGRKKKKDIRKIEVGSIVKQILTNEEYTRLLHVCDNSEYVLEDKFIVRTMLTIGFRLGEVVHFKKCWVNFDQKTITIPAHEPCNCGYCKSQLKRQLKRIGKSKEEQESISEKEVMNYYWQPKTNAGVRVVYYGFDSEYEMILNDYFSKYDGWPGAYITAYRRIRKLLDLAGLQNHVDHHLRKTAGTNYAAAGLTEHQLMDVMGWDDADVAREYIRLYGPRSVESQKKVLGEGKKKGYISDSRIALYLTAFGRQVLTRRKYRDEEEWLRDVLFSKKDDTERKITDY